MGAGAGAGASERMKVELEGQGRSRTGMTGHVWSIESFTASYERQLQEPPIEPAESRKITANDTSV